VSALRGGAAYVAQILAHFGDRLRFVYRHFPLIEVHPVAGPAAEAAEFAGSRGLFWQMHESIFANQQRLSVPLLITLAANLKLSPIALRDALAAGTFAPKVRGFPRRRAKRCQRNTDFLRKRRTTRQPLWRSHSSVSNRSGDPCRRCVTDRRTLLDSGMPTRVISHDLRLWTRDFAFDFTGEAL